MFSKLTIAAMGAFAISSLLVAAAPTELHKDNADVEIVINCNNTGQVALTFDDGPYLYEQDIAARLTKSGFNGTFFLNGNNFDCIYNHVDEIRAIHADNHTLGSHGWSHKDMTTLSLDEINEELELVEEAFIRILGLKPRLFRPPFGAYNDLLVSVLAKRGYTKLVLWTDDSLDGFEVPADESKAIYDEAAKNYPEPHIILGHSVYESTADDVTPYGISLLKGKGYQLVGVDACLDREGISPYTYVGKPQNGTWQC